MGDPTILLKIKIARSFYTSAEPNMENKKSVGKISLPIKIALLMSTISRKLVWPIGLSFLWVSVEVIVWLVSTGQYKITIISSLVFVSLICLRMLFGKAFVWILQLTIAKHSK